jgi:hypothetical protein
MPLDEPQPFPPGLSPVLRLWHLETSASSDQPAAPVLLSSFGSNLAAMAASNRARARSSGLFGSRGGVSTEPRITWFCVPD